jgi:acetyltransferase-like isoleucine patch superfamily enzyme
MFERYTEKARRVIFFARYEASQVGATHIETEHLLLGLLREDKALANRFLRGDGSADSIRRQIEGHTTIRERIATSVDLPLSDECKRILASAAEEAEKLGHKHVGTEHLLLGTLREEGCSAASILQERGVEADQVRDELSRMTNNISGTVPGRQVEKRASLQKLIEALVGLDDETIGKLQALLDAQKEGREEKTTEQALPEIGGEAGDPPTVSAQRIDLTKVQSTTPLGIKLLRALWHCFQLPFFEHTPRVLSPLRIFLLRLFGAKIGPGCQIDGGVKVWIPWNLRMGAHSTIGFNSEIYNFAPVGIGDHVVISQRGYICTATHDYTHPHFPLVSARVTIQSQAWVAAAVFIAPNVTIGEGAVIGACSVVTKSMPAWTICAGNPCRPLKPRIMKAPE